MVGQGFGFGSWTPEGRALTEKLNAVREKGLGYVPVTFDEYKQHFEQHLNEKPTEEQLVFIEAEIEYNTLMSPHIISGKDYAKRAKFATEQKANHRQLTLF